MKIFVQDWNFRAGMIDTSLWGRNGFTGYRWALVEENGELLFLYRTKRAALESLLAFTRYSQPA